MKWLNYIQSGQIESENIGRPFYLAGNGTLGLRPAALAFFFLTFVHKNPSE